MSKLPDGLTYYFIVKFNSEKLQYEIIFYTHNIEEFQQKQLQYPESDETGTIHLINLKYCKAHEFLEQMRSYRNAQASNSASG